MTDNPAKLTNDAADSDAAPHRRGGLFARPVAFLARIARRVGAALRCAALGVLALGCSPERSRSSGVTSVRVEPARAARFADARTDRNTNETSGALGAREARGTGDTHSAGSFTSISDKERASGKENPDEVGASRTSALSDTGDPRDGTRSGRRDLALSSVELEPGVNEEFDEDTVLDVDDALSATDENAFATLIKKEQVWINGELVKKEKTAHPDNCRRWRYFKNRGYAPKSANAKQIDAGALVRCGSLEFLARARPSRVSHVRNLLVGAGPGSFPAIIASASSPLALQARDRAVSRGSTFAEFLPNARIIPSELPGRLSFAEPASDSSVILNAEVWGDINADGIEDLALSVLNSADDGTSFVMRLLHVTRPSASAALKVLAVVE